jgi:hypothetical protein
VLDIPHTARRASAPALALGLGLLCLACATPPGEDEVAARLRRAASSVRGIGSSYLVVPVCADSRVAAWTLLAEARGEGATEASRRLHYDFRREAARGRGVVVGGPFSDLTREVVLDALALEDRPLDGLTLVYVGEARYAEALRRAALARRARFHHRELP